MRWKSKPFIFRIAADFFEHSPCEQSHQPITMVVRSGRHVNLFVSQICVAAGEKSFDLNISCPNNLHFCVVYSLCPRCVMALNIRWLYLKHVCFFRVGTKWDGIEFEKWPLFKISTSFVNQLMSACKAQSWNQDMISLAKDWKQMKQPDAFYPLCLWNVATITSKDHWYNTVLIHLVCTLYINGWKKKYSLWFS